MTRAMLREGEVFIDTESGEILTSEGDVIELKDIRQIFVRWNEKEKIQVYWELMELEGVVVACKAVEGITVAKLVEHHHILKARDGFLN